MVAQAQSRPSSSTGLNFAGLVVALLFLALAIACFGVIVNNVILTFQARLPDEGAGTTLLRFLDSYGLIIPLVLAGIGVFLLNLSYRLFRMDSRAAAWAQQFLLWILVVCAVLFLQQFSAGTNTAGSMGDGIAAALPFAIAAVLFGGAYWWLSNNQGAYRGQETLMEASSRSAWNLLLPTIAIMVLVALRPLEETFITSLTDRTFASARETTFVGFDNYAALLGVRIDTIPCKRDAATGACGLDRNGNIDFPSERAYFESIGDSSYRDLGFDDIQTIALPGGESQLVISARDETFFDAIGNTLIFTIFSVTLELLLGLGIAIIINSKFSGRGLMRAAMLVPWAIPTVVSARLWEIMLRDNQSGVVNHFFTQVIPLFSTSQAWLANASLELPALIAVDVWKTTPFMALILLAGLQVIPGDIYEAADVDGANKVRQFFSLTLPLLRPTIAVALVFRTLDAVRVFDVFNVLLGDRTFSLATYNYNTLVLDREAGYASAIGVVIFVIILIFTVAYVRVLGVNAE